MYTSIGDLSKSRYVSLTTFRRDGSEASTPVWVVSDDGVRLLVWTGANTWKAKRIQRDPRVLVAPSNGRGHEQGGRFAGHARLLGPEAAPLVVPLLRRKYGWQRYGLELWSKLTRSGGNATYIEIT
jgi:uncharacterized protein